METITWKQTQVYDTSYTLIFKRIGQYIALWGISIFMIHGIEILASFYQMGFTKEYPTMLAEALFEDIIFFIKSVPFIALWVSITERLSPKICELLFIFLFLFLAILSLYFSHTTVLLGADLMAYSINDIRHTVLSSHFSGLMWAELGIFCLVFTLAFFSKNRWEFSPKWVFRFAVGCFFLLFLNISSPFVVRNEYAQNLSHNKARYFFNSLLTYTADDTRLASSTPATEPNFPFQRLDNTPDVLSNFMQTSAHKPNMVFIVVEGLGRAFSGENAYLGSFTPFLDSLAKQSLYWGNFLSEGGRTFAVLPSLFGSLPFGKSGFTELNPMPKHHSLISILQQQGYQTAFFHGGNANFDNMRAFLEQNKIHKIIDEGNFGGNFQKMPSKNGFSWGYGDKELFERYLQEHPSTQPRLDILLTLSSHDPFLLHEEAKYAQLFENHLKNSHFDPVQEENSRKYKKILTTILYVDDAIRHLMNEYRKRPDFENTIFVITGDHRLPEIPLATKLDRYHVPLLVYSPMLKEPARFKSISTHFDVTPSFVAFLHKNYGLKRPSHTHWLGDGLDISPNFRNTHAYPLMMTKSELVDFIDGKYWLSGNDVFEIMPSMDLERREDFTKLKLLQSKLSQFKLQNQSMIYRGIIGN